jgi:hypothetical protein
VDDGRNYLLTTDERYDVITSEPMPPTFSGVVNLYSREYYALARRRLKPGGVLAQWLPIHLLTEAETWAILRTVQEVFPHTSLWMHVGTGIILARADGPAMIDLERTRERLASSDLRRELARLTCPGLDDLITRYTLGPDAIRRLTLHAGLITDNHPTLEFHSPSHAQTLHFGRYRLASARVLEAILRLTLGERLPLVRSDPETTARLEGMLAISAHLRLAELYHAVRDSRLAELEFKSAEALATTPELQGRFYFEQARLALLNGRPSATSRLAGQSLAAVPDQAGALELLSRLESRR